MKGKAVAAVSNASAPRGLVPGTRGSEPLFHRHTWLADGEKEYGPLEMQFESKVNLISLNIDLTFSCQGATAPLTEGSVPKKPEAEPSSLIGEDTAVIGDDQRQEDPLKSLGPFTIKVGEAPPTGEDSKPSQTSSSQPRAEGAQYLRLMVHHHKGA